MLLEAISDSLLYVLPLLATISDFTSETASQDMCDVSTTAASCM